MNIAYKTIANNFEDGQNKKMNESILVYSGGLSRRPAGKRQNIGHVFHDFASGKRSALRRPDIQNFR